MVVFLGPGARSHRGRVGIVVGAGLLRTVILGGTLALALVVDVAGLLAARLRFTLGIAFVQDVDDFRVLECQMLLARVADGELVVLREIS